MLYYSKVFDININWSTHAWFFQFNSISITSDELQERRGNHNISKPVRRPDEEMFGLKSTKHTKRWKPIEIFMYNVYASFVILQTSILICEISGRAMHCHIKICLQLFWRQSLAYQLYSRHELLY